MDRITRKKNRHLDYMHGFCDIFARAAQKRYGFKMFAFFELRSICTKKGLTQSRGIIHAFVTVEYRDDEWIIFDAKGIRSIKEVIDEYCIDETMWIDPVNQDELKKLAYVKYNQKHDCLLMSDTKHYIRNVFPKSLFKPFNLGAIK